MKKIETVVIDPTLAPAHTASVKITAMKWLPYPVHPDTSRPDAAGLAKLKTFRNELKQKLDKLQKDMLAYGSSAEIPSKLQHRFYVTAREYMEANLSIFWNDNAAKGIDPLFVDKKLYKLATEYNDMRIMRRMYDYIIDIDSRGSSLARPIRLPLQWRLKLKSSSDKTSKPKKILKG